MLPCLFIVVPCYFDENVLPHTAPVFLKKLEALVNSGKITEESRVLFVNDGSTDGTWNVIKRLHDENPRVIGINLKENVGEQNAILAGTSYASAFADCIITMDSDLQDDINVVDSMLERFGSGAEIVLGVRSSREGDSPKERFFSACFYDFMRLLRTGLIRNHSNCRLMSREAASVLASENNAAFFLPAYVSNMPFKKETVSYVRRKREFGESGYDFSMKFKMAVSAAFLHSPFLNGLPVTARLEAKNRPQFEIAEIYPSE